MFVLMYLYIYILNIVIVILKCVKDVFIMIWDYITILNYSFYIVMMKLVSCFLRDMNHSLPWKIKPSHLFMISRCKESVHHQPWYWSELPKIVQQSTGTPCIVRSAFRPGRWGDKFFQMWSSRKMRSVSLLAMPWLFSYSCF